MISVIFSSKDHRIKPKMLLLCCKYQKTGSKPLKTLKKRIFLSKKYLKQNSWKNVGLIRRPLENFLCYAILEDPGSSKLGGRVYEGTNDFPRKSTWIKAWSLIEKTAIASVEVFLFPFCTIVRKMLFNRIIVLEKNGRKNWLFWFFMSVSFQSI